MFKTMLWKANVMLMHSLYWYVWKALRKKMQNIVQTEELTLGDDRLVLIKYAKRTN